MSRLDVSEEELNGLTYAGREWFTLATDPFHDFKVHPKGVPDIDGSETVCYAVRKRFVVTRPATITAETAWDCHISWSPLVSAPMNDPDTGIGQYGMAGAATSAVFSDIGQWPAPASGPGGRWGEPPLRITCGDTGCHTFPEALPWDDVDQPSLWHYFPEQFYHMADSDMRIAGLGVEVKYIGAPINATGSVTCYQQPQVTERWVAPCYAAGTVGSSSSTSAGAVASSGTLVCGVDDTTSLVRPSTCDLPPICARPCQHLDCLRIRAEVKNEVVDGPATIEAGRLLLRPPSLASKSPRPYRPLNHAPHRKTASDPIRATESIPDTTLIATYGGYQCMLPPATVAEAARFPSSTEWHAKEGAYMVARLNQGYPRFGSLGPGSCLQCARTVHYATWVDASMTWGIVDLPFYDNAVDVDAGPSGSMALPYDGFGAYFTGLNHDDAALVVNTIAFLEVKPRISARSEVNGSQDPIISFLTPSPPLDEVALALYSRVAPRMPVATQVANNKSGGWWKKVLQIVRIVTPELALAIGTIVPEAALPMAMVAAGAEVARRGQAPFSSRSAQRRITLPQPSVRRNKKKKTKKAKRIMR